MVDEFAADAKRNAAHRLTKSTRKQYGPEMKSFGRFATYLRIPLPENIFAPNAATLDDLHEVLKSYALYLRREGESRTHDMDGHPMHMLSATIASKISALIDDIRSHNQPLGAALERHKDKPTALSYQLSALHQEDQLLRGELDSYRKLPIGIQFIEHSIALIPTLVHSSLVSAYTVTLLFEFVFGPRTYQVLVRSGIAHLNNCPPTDNEHLTIPRDLDALEDAAGIHSVKNSDVLFNYLELNPPRFFTLDQARLMPPYPPTSISVFGTQKQHQGGVEHPSIICQNPHLPGSANVCLVTSMHAYIKATPDRAAHGFVFSEVKSPLMTKVIKTTAQQVGYDPRRTFLSSIRIGCASASTADIFDMDQDMVNRLVQYHQQWKTPAGSAPYRVSQLDASLVKTIQLMNLSTTSIAYVIARFITRFQK